MEHIELTVLRTQDCYFYLDQQNLSYLLHIITTKEPLDESERGE